MNNGFKEIRMATGLESLDDIVTVFIKSEEQQHEMLSNLNALNSEIDNLEEVSERLHKEINLSYDHKAEGEQSVHDKIQKLKNECKHYDEKSKSTIEKSL